LYLSIVISEIKGEPTELEKALDKTYIKIPVTESQHSKLLIRVTSSCLAKPEAAGLAEKDVIISNTDPPVIPLSNF
jgi:hypothetical protein